ncbi:MFS transporter [Bacillus sp. IITD106]|nr:MFS transporter [Bacillus sp. IITD106]
MVISQRAFKPKGLFGNRFFRTVLFSNVLLQIGIWVRNFAILLFVKEQSGGDSVTVSLIYVAEYAPIFIFSFIGGTFADRWKPKLTMIWCDILSAVSVFLVLLALMLGNWHTIFLVTLISAILSQFSQPSGMRLFKQHLPGEQLQQAMAFFQSLIAIFMVCGPFLGSFVYSHFGIETSIAVMGTAFLFSAVVLLWLPPDIETKQTIVSDRNFWREFADGFCYVWRSRVLRTLGIIFTLTGMSVGIGQALSIFIVTERLNQPDEFLSFLLATNGLAMLLGVGLIGTVAKKVAPQKLIAFGMVISGASTLVIGFSKTVPLTLVSQFVGGFFFPAFQVGIMTMVLSWSDQAYVGRVNGVLNPTFTGGMIVMLLIAGFLKKTMPLPAIYTVSSVLIGVGALVLVPIFKHTAPERSGEAAELPETDGDVIGGY